MKVVVAVAGMPGAGKGVFSSAAKQRGIPVYVCGDVIREEAKRRGVPPTRESLGNLMFQLRTEKGEAIVIQRLMATLKADDSLLGVVEGVRSLAEIKELKKQVTVYICAIHTSPEKRFKRLKARNRSDDPHNLKEFTTRDLNELRVGLGEVIALADRMIINEGTIEEFISRSQQILMDVKECHTK